MQETQYPSGDSIKSQKELFRVPSDASLEAAMDARLGELKAQGHTLVRRKRVKRNDPCICGSRKKFKKCCIDK